MKIESTRFGELELEDEHFIRFPEGLPGFQGEKTFVLIEPDLESPFSFLQSAEEADLTFLLADPFVFFPEYEFVLEDEVAEELKLSEKNPPRVFLIATVRENLSDMTVNLLAPLVINQNSRTGRQVILNKTEYTVRQKLFPNGLPMNKTKGGA